VIHNALERDAHASTVLGSILRTAREFVALRSESPERGPLDVDDAVYALQRTMKARGAEPTWALLVGALGFFPIDTIVQLNTGEVAAIAGVPKLPENYRRPPVRLLTDASANTLRNPRNIDLGDSDPNQPGRTVLFSLGVLDGSPARST